MQAPAILYDPCYLPGEISRVTKVRNGIARELWHPDRNLAVVCQASHVPALEEGDDVLYMQTQAGVYIIARTLKGDELPAKYWQQSRGDKVELSVGKSFFCMEKSGAIQIKTPHADLTINPQGKVEINSTELIQAAQGAVQINSGSR